MSTSFYRLKLNVGVALIDAARRGVIRYTTLYKELMNKISSPTVVAKDRMVSI